MERKVDVVVGLIMNDQSKVLSQLRKKGAHLGGYWEFPGGKVESGETKQQAVIRELAEEIGVDVRAVKRLGLIEHTYKECLVRLSVYKVKDYYGRPWAREEGTELEWLTPRELLTLKCLPTCQKITQKWLAPTKCEVLHLV